MARVLHEKVKLAKALTVSGLSGAMMSPNAVMVEGTLSKMPEGSWHLRAVASNGLECPASTVTLDPESLKVVAEIPNPYELDLELTDLLVNLGDD